MHKDLGGHLRNLNFDISVYIVKWFFSFFCIDLPQEYVLQILDFYQYEQTAVLIRVALTIFLLLAPKLLEAQTEEDLHEILRKPYNNIRKYS